MDKDNKEIPSHVRDYIDDNIDSIRQDVSTMKGEMYSFSMQFASISIGLVSIIFAIIIGFGTTWDFDKYGETVTMLLLAYISFILTIWFLSYHKKNG